jgi:hypothetical protein
MVGSAALSALIAVESVVIALLTVLVFGLLRSHADILRALHDLGVHAGPPASNAPGAALPTEALGAEPGRGAHDLAGAAPGGDAIAVAVDKVEHDTLLAFLSSGCLSCQAIWQALRDGASVPGGSRVVVVTRDAAEESVSAIAGLAEGVPAPVVLSSAAWDAYEVPVAPYFVHVEGRTGRVTGEGAAPSWARVLHLVAQARADERGVRSSVELLADRAARAQIAAWSADRDREARNDQELLAAGITPGDPRLMHGRGAPGDTSR